MKSYTPISGMYVSNNDSGDYIEKADYIKLRSAALTFAATAIVLIKNRAMLLPPEREKWEAACGELNQVLGDP